MNEFGTDIIHSHRKKKSSAQSWIVIRIIDLNSPVQQNV